MRRITSAVPRTGCRNARSLDGLTGTASRGQSETFRRFASSSTREESKGEQSHADEPQNSDDTKPTRVSKKKPSKTVTQADEELRSRLDAMSGDGGAAGVEYENGVAEGLKDGVKRNMFRII